MSRQGRRRRYNWKRISLLVLALVVVLAGAFFVFNLLFRKEKLPETLQNSHYTLHEAGELAIEEIITKNYIVAAHYPVFSNKDIDHDIATFLDERISAFEEMNAEYKPESKDDRKLFVLDYETTVVTDKYVSVIFYTAESTRLENLDYQLLLTRTYDLATGKQVALEEIFSGNYLQKTAAIIRSDYRKSGIESTMTATETFFLGTAAEAANYQYFALKDDKLRVYFSPGQVFETETAWTYRDVSISDLAFYLQESYPAKNVIQPTLTDINSARYIDPDKPMIAITFDDGPSSVATQRILTSLNNNNSAATFFVVGSRVDSHASLIEAIVSGGHELANHTYNHDTLTLLNEEQFHSTLNRTDEALAKYTDQKIYLMRPVGGSYNQNVKNWSAYPLILWNIDTEDWKNRDANAVYNIVMNQARDGAIILCHDLYESTAAAAERFIPDLVAKGYQLVTVTELAEYRGIVLQPGEVYFSLPRGD